MGEQHSDQRSKVALLAKIVSIITFPGFVAAAGFWLLREGVYVSEDLLGENVVMAHLHFSGALFGYVLVPLFFVFFLLWLKKIDSIKMPLLADRKWGFLGAIVGALKGGATIEIVVETARCNYDEYFKGSLFIPS
jgi:hypothetical protein